MNLTDRNWNAFQIGTFFTIVRGNAKDANTRTHVGDISLVSALDNTNAYSGATTASKKEKVYKNCITVHNNGNGVGLAFVHQYDFVATSDVSILKQKRELFNEYALRFLATAIRQQKPTFCYGYKLSNSRLERLKVMLPVDSNGTPDFVFMEAYMKEIEQKLLKKYADYQSCNTEKLAVNKPFAWRAFNIGSVFPDIQRGKRLKTEAHIDGTKAYVSSSADNNAIDAFIGNEKRIREFEDCLTLANSGSVGFTAYHPYRFVASDHVTKLKREGLSKYAYLFIAVSVSRLAEKYSFNREINDKRLKREVIMLPVKRDDSPDYEFMDSFMRKLEAQQIQKYLSFKSC